MIQTIERDDVQRAINTGATIAEVLPLASYEAGHLPGAVHLPLEGLESVAEALDRDAMLILYCSGPTCGNSHRAAERLVRAGFSNVRVFSGGKAAWREAGLSLEVSR